MKSKPKGAYATAGVDIDAANQAKDLIKHHARSTFRPEVLTDIGLFGGMFQFKGYKEPVLVSSVDGVGTKLKIAALLDRHDTVGIDLVNHCVNDILCCGAEPLFFLDYIAMGKLVPQKVERIVSGLARACCQAGCALVGGETAEMPGMYHGKDYDLAGFAVGAVERKRLLPANDVGPSDVVLGLASSGPHSNGYSLIRKIVEMSALSYGAPAPFASGKSLGEALLAPTRIYVKSLLKVFAKTKSIKALAHITGGGFLENIPRILPKTCVAEIDLGAVPYLPVFKWLEDVGGTPTREMLRTFNCGIGMIVVVKAGDAKAVAAALKKSGEKVVTLGSLRRRKGKEEQVATTGALSLA